MKRVRELIISSAELFANEIVLKRQEFTQDNGAYFTMRYYSAKL
ncbi:hypothetical protein [Roseivirga sp. 4D4]|nr:hypothetical protein [Roseivirga sp. 4D4]